MLGFFINIYTYTVYDIQNGMIVRKSSCSNLKTAKSNYC